jgi:hypothetical protein
VEKLDHVERLGDVRDLLLEGLLALVQVLVHETVLPVLCSSHQRITRENCRTREHLGNRAGRTRRYDVRALRDSLPRSSINPISKRQDAVCFFCFFLTMKGAFGIPRGFFSSLVVVVVVVVVLAMRETSLVEMVDEIGNAHHVMSRRLISSYLLFDNRRVGTALYSL